MLFQAINTKYIKASVIASIINIVIQVFIFLYQMHRIEEVKALRKEGLATVAEVARAEAFVSISAITTIITIFVIFGVIKMVREQYTYLNNLNFLNQDIFKEKETNDHTQ